MRVVKRDLLALLAGLLMVPALTACSSSGDTIDAGLGIEGAPAWVNLGSRAEKRQDARLISGVGSAPQLDDRIQQKGNADNRARAEVARILATYLEMMIEDYSNANNGVGRQALLQTVGSGTRVLLREVRLVGNWRNPRDGTLYALAELDMDAVQDLMRTSRIMDSDFQRFFIANSDQIYDRVHQRVK